MARAARAGDTVAHVHLSERGSFVREGGLLAVAQVLGLPSVATLHGAEFEPFARAHRRLVQTVLRQASVVVTLGPAMRDFIHAEVDDGLSIEVVPNPIEVGGPSDPAGDALPVAIFAGELGARKGVDILLRAWPAVRSLVPDAELIVCGPPGDVTGPRCLEGLRWLGLRQRDDVAGMLDNARVAVLPSRSEVMSMFLLEAMARARPVVTTPIGEHGWLVADGSGIMVPVGDVAALTGALVAYLSDPSSASASGAAARSLIEARHAGGVVAVELERIYDAIANSRRPLLCPRSRPAIRSRSPRASRVSGPAPRGAAPPGRRSLGGHRGRRGYDARRRS
jgi:glycosyltransferase involved in cell wall biosynthesis